MLLKSRVNQECQGLKLYEKRKKGQFLSGLGHQRLPCLERKTPLGPLLYFPWIGGLFIVCTNTSCCVLWLLGVVRFEDEDIDLGNEVSGEIIKVWT